VFQTFQIAFGHDSMSAETRDVLLYGKLQDGLHLDNVSKAPAISGAQSCQKLCIAAKNEETWLAELSKYIPRRVLNLTRVIQNQQLTFNRVEDDEKKDETTSQRQRCYSPGYIIHDCRVSKSRVEARLE